MTASSPLALRWKCHYALIEAVAGFWLHSLALVADAGHNLSDVLGLLLAGLPWWFRGAKTLRAAFLRPGRTSILAALANAVLLFVALGATSGRPSVD